MTIKHNEDSILSKETKKAYKKIVDRAIERIDKSRSLDEFLFKYKNRKPKWMLK